MRGDGQRFKYVSERDIDLLLLEELTTAPEFREWLVEQIGIDGDGEIEFIDTWHSVSDPQLGESDIEFGLRTEAGETLLVMVENKIDATFQDNQLQRYQSRGEKALSDDWTAFAVCLFAPEGYLDQAESKYAVDAVVTYEELREWFSQRDSRRASFKVSMLDEAIKQERRGYSSEPDEAVTKLHQYYWSILRSDFPDLEMDRPTGVPAGNLWIRFKIPALPEDVKLRHKMGKGYVDLAIRGAGNELEEFKQEYESQLEEGMYIESSGSSVFIRTHVPPISADSPPEQQEEQIRTGLEVASRKLDWYQKMVNPNKSNP